jgi:hypothetical protein
MAKSCCKEDQGRLVIAKRRDLLGMCSSDLKVYDETEYMQDGPNSNLEVKEITPFDKPVVWSKFKR